MSSFIFLIIGFVLLIKCADLFVDGSSKLASSLGIPSLIIGLTIVAFGTSAPEAAVSITASLKGMNDISLGNVVGSNICNLLLVLGLSGMFGSLTAKKKIISRDFIYAIFAGLVLFILSFGFFKTKTATGVIDREDGLILLCFLGIYLYALIGDAVRSVRSKEEKEKFEIKNIFFIIIGIVGIIIGGQLVVNNATAIAKLFNVSDNVIALTVVAIGTSLPELVTSVIASKKGESDIAIGNVVGSNIFNVFFILGITSTISPVSFGFESFIDIIFALAASVLVYVLTLKNYRIGNKKGIILLGSYIAYMAYILIR